MGIKQKFEALQQAIIEGDFERMQSFLTADFSLNEPPALPFGGKFRGPQGYVDLIQKIGEFYKVEPIHSKLTEAGNELLVCEFVMGFTSNRTGEYVETSVVDLYHYDASGLVTHVDAFYMDPGKVAAIA